MATSGKSRFESDDSVTNFQAQEIARFLKSKKLESLSLIMLDMIIPFKRQFSALVSVAEPLSSILFGHEKSGKILDFSRGESSFEALREELERGDE